jgi:segregation and condensation protein A
MSDASYKVKLENIFEGPMDLLVHLIKKNELNIYDIPVALVTRQFLEYLDWMQMMNIDYAGDFIVMASTLTQIKSKMLLPVHDEDDDDDPRQELIKPLMEYLQLKSAAGQLAERTLLGNDTFARSSKPDDLLEDSEDRMIQVGLFELIDAFQKILDNLPSDQLVEFTPDRVSVKERITEIVDILEEKGSATFGELFAQDAAKSEVIVTFLAILEMVKLSLVRVAQHVQTGIIRLFYL